MSTSDPPLKLKSNLPDDPEQVQLERYVAVAGNDVRRRARIPVLTDEVDPEFVLRTYDEFRDICDAARLSLGTGALKFEYFRQTLRGQARRHWDAVLTEVCLLYTSPSPRDS